MLNEFRGQLNAKSQGAFAVSRSSLHSCTNSDGNPRPVVLRQKHECLDATLCCIHYNPDWTEAQVLRSQISDAIQFITVLCGKIRWEVLGTCARCHQVLFSRYPYTWEGGRRTDQPGGSHITSGEGRDFLLSKCSQGLACTSCHDPHGADQADRGRQHGRRDRPRDLHARV